MLLRFYLSLIFVHCIGIGLTFAQTTESGELPFATNSTHLTVWNGTEYQPIFVKGINLGVSKPGTSVQELAASAEDYARWFPMIKEAGFNTIRVFTLHYPRFYEELARYNQNHPDDPLLLMQGIWLEQEGEFFSGDLYNLTAEFDQEIHENVRAIHGDITINARVNKAYGNYFTDVSQWTLAYIIGREILPEEVVETNTVNDNISGFDGVYLSIENVDASEAWLIERLDRLIELEFGLYETMRPVSFSSWPTLDPLSHPNEPNQFEDMAALDISDLDFSRAPAGVFASYHVYPYYPEFISRDPEYLVFNDDDGQNGYLGYLHALNRHYNTMPVIIAEFGVPSSLGNAHYALNGMHFGGHSEQTQGEIGERMFRNVHESGSGGGIWFSWIDEWFKRTWITQPLDSDAARRKLWHNVMSPEQNFGLLKYERPVGNLSHWETYNGESDVISLYKGVDPAFLHLRIDLAESMSDQDTLWISLDTYRPRWGELKLPNGQRLINASEFALRITLQDAQLYVIQVYDTFGALHGLTNSAQRLRSEPSDGKPWNPVHWVNKYPDLEIQGIGALRVRDETQTPTSLDAVVFENSAVYIKLPWNLIHFTDPSALKVLHDNPNTPLTWEVLTSDGINVGIFYKTFANETSSRYRWDAWNVVENLIEIKKESWEHFSEFLPGFPGEVVSISSMTDHVSSRDISAIIYPNPANGNVRILTEKTIDVLEIYTITGQKVHRVEVGNTMAQISLHNLSSGIYFIRVLQSDEVGTYKLTVLK